MELYSSIEILDGFFKLTYVKNTGAAFGIFKHSLFFLIIATGIMIIAIGVAAFILSIRSSLLAAGFGLILGGAMGNFIDRLRMGYVVDFLHLSLWPTVFNIADVSVVTGAILLGYKLLFSGSHRSDFAGKGLEIGHLPEGKTERKDLPLDDTAGYQRGTDHGQWGDQKTQLPVETGRKDHPDDSKAETH
ncbi:MAG: signal peptidase [Thermotogota bacterium]|nr:signal peptidase [Thermotogota bacterium]